MGWAGSPHAAYLLSRVSFQRTSCASVACDHNSRDDVLLPELRDTVVSSVNIVERNVHASRAKFNPSLLLESDGGASYPD